MGGVAGHLNHIHENLDFTIGEIKEILRDVASAEMETVEKVDGQNLFFSYDVNTGEIKTARNGGDVNKGGMTPGEFAAKWKDHPAEGAFTEGFAAIERGISRLSPEQLTKIFGTDGKVYVNAEIMFVNNPNIINYGGNYIVLHNLHTFDDAGHGTVTSRGPFQELVTAIEDAEGQLDAANWGTSGPRTVQLNNIIEGGHYEDLVAALDALGLADDATLGDYVEEMLRAGDVGNLPIPVHKQEELIKRIIGFGNGLATSEVPNLRAIKDGLSKEIQKQVSSLATKANAQKTISRILAPVEKAISDFAIEVLRGLKSFFLDDHDAEISRMRAELESSIEQLQAAAGLDAEKMGEMLEKQLSKLGDIENIASTMEGVVFEHPPGSEILYKLTGAFAMVNQIIGRARRATPKEEEANEAIFPRLWRILNENTSPGETVAVVPGAFKPPHLGHVKMAEHYSNLADKVIIVISTPRDPKPKRLKSGKLSKAKLKTSKRFIGNKEVTPQMAVGMWNAIASHIPNLEVRISSQPSPVSVAYDMIGSNSPFPPGTRVILGASEKGGDVARFANAITQASPDLDVPDPAEFAAPAASMSGGFIQRAEELGILDQLPSSNAGKDPGTFHASDLRFLIHNACTAPELKELIGYYVGPANVDALIASCGLDNISDNLKRSFNLPIFVL